MQGRQILLQILTEQRVGWTEIARRVGGKETTQNVRQRIMRPGEENPKDLTVSLLVKYADALGYEVVIREKGKKRGQEYVISEEGGE